MRTTRVVYRTGRRHPRFHNVWYWALGLWSIELAVWALALMIWSILVAVRVVRTRRWNGGKP